MSIKEEIFVTFSPESDSIQKIIVANLTIL